MTVPKIITQSKTSDASYADDDDLSFPVEEDGIYAIRFKFWFDTAAAADFQWQLSGPSGGTLRANGHWVVPNSTTHVDWRDTAFSTTHPITGSGTTGGFVQGEATFTNGSTGGVIAIQWSQNTSNAGTTQVLAGSYLEYLKI